LAVDKKSEKILTTNFSKGKVHDFELFKRSKLTISKSTRMEVDMGYKGMHKIHSNCRMPKKKSKYHPLTKTDIAKNKQISKSRIRIEHVIRRLKIFRIVSERYRNRRRRFELRMNLIAGIYNFENE
jgi:transposase